MKKKHEVVHKLELLLKKRTDIKKALEDSIHKANQEGVKTIQAFYDLSNSLLTAIPSQRELDPDTQKFFYVLNKSPKGFLKKDKEFNDWVVEFTKEFGNFLDTADSAKSLETFISNPIYQIEEYDKGPSGWLTFNQFFARRVKPGKRPIAEPCNNDVIVSTTDSVFQGCWPVHNATITTKSIEHSVIDLLDGSPYQDKFREGVFTHSYLNINDYHRYSTPVGGLIREINKIPGKVMLDVVKNPKGVLDAEDGLGFQMTQTRGLIIIESSIGYVAVLPVGMGHVSSVNITAEENIFLAKGEEFGYFCFGGSDMIMIFEPNRVEFTARPGKHYKQGQQIGKALHR